ncbi:hypothetical protein Q1695_004825 [Nippostrongylus brasiliensis]|nr:hypothetical protein Q1695_004825 [Nippostrongylus brasiliensis]
MIDCASILIVIAIFLLKTTSGLICYDSLDPRPKPNQIVECSAEMMCYSEYYALNRSGVLRQYFDRFCVHQKQCTHRGIDQECQSLEQLDIRIQRTFFKYHHSKPSRETLLTDTALNWFHALTSLFMDHQGDDLNQNKRLKEMARLSKKTNGKTGAVQGRNQASWPKRQQRPSSSRRNVAPQVKKSTSARAPSTRAVQPPPPEVPPPPPVARSPVDCRRKPAKKETRKSERAQEEEEEESISADLSRSEKRRREIRKKYGLKKSAEERFNRSDDEEFENVNVKLRPAATKMRKAKLKWKQPETRKKHSTSAATDNSGGSLSSDLADLGGTGAVALEEFDFGDDFDEDSTQSLREKKLPSARSLEALANMKGKPNEKVEKLLREIHVLLKRVDHLEETQRRAASFIKRLRIRLAKREKKISELSSRIKQLEYDDAKKSAESAKSPTNASPTSSFRGSVELPKQKAPPAPEPKAPEPKVSKSAEEEKPTPGQEAVALRGLDIMKRNQILEQIIKPHEADVLAKFFESNASQPNPTVIKLIDKAIGYGIEVLLMRPDLFEDVVDNELRLFLLDGSRAKQVLRECMLQHTDYVPSTWGGEMLSKRRQQQPTPKRAAQAAPKEEKAGPHVPPSRSFFNFIMNPFVGGSAESNEKSDGENSYTEKRRSGGSDNRQENRHHQSW